MKIKLSKKQWQTIGKTAGWMKTAETTTAREFYHGTSSGKNNDNIASLRKGINPSMAQGYGQGPGFYVWLDKNTAINHCKEFSKGGYNMVVTVQAELSPQNFDLDHEVMSKMTGQFIYDNWDNLFKKLPENTINTERGVLNIGKSKKVPENTVMVFWCGAGRTVAKKPTTESNVGTGEIFGTIFNAIQKQFPQETYRFESEAFNQAIINKNSGLKYVGDQRLIPSKIECLVNNQWIDVTSQDPPIPQQLQTQQQPSQTQV